MIRRKNSINVSIAGVLCCLGMTAFAVDFDDVRNLPEDNKVMFLMGQDSDTLSDYKHDVLDQDITMPRPAGFTIYTPLFIIPDNEIPPGLSNITINSLTGTGNWGDNNHSLSRSVSEYPEGAIAIGLNIVDPISFCGNRALRAIADTGEEDVVELTPRYHEAIDQTITILKDTARPVYLRIGYEFDGPWNCYSQEHYKEAFRFIKNRIDDLGAENIATVWQGAAFLFDDQAGRLEYSASQPGHLDRWYPGDEYVDWMGTSTFLGEHYSVYQASGVEAFIAKTPRELQNEFLDYAREHNKPVLIAEASPQGFDIGNLNASSIFLRMDASVTAQEIWATWYEDWFDFIEDNKDVVRGVAYINSNWNDAPLWRCDEGAQTEFGQSVPFDPNNPDAPICPGASYWGDARVQANDEILELFKAELQQEHFVNGGKGIELPNVILNDKTTLLADDELDYKLLVDADGSVIVKLKTGYRTYGKIAVTFNDQTIYRYVFGAKVLKFKFKNVERNQENLNVKVLHGQISVKKIKAKLRAN